MIQLNFVSIKHWIVSLYTFSLLIISVPMYSVSGIVYSEHSAIRFSRDKTVAAKHWSICVLLSSILSRFKLLSGHSWVYVYTNAMTKKQSRARPWYKSYLKLINFLSIQHCIVPLCTFSLDIYCVSMYSVTWIVYSEHTAIGFARDKTDAKKNSIVPMWFPHYSVI